MRAVGKKSKRKFVPILKQRRNGRKTFPTPVEPPANAAHSQKESQTTLSFLLHKLIFANDLWLLNPSTDLLVALMPLPFFIWYAGEMLKSMLPVLGMMALIIIAWLKTRKTQKETETK